MVQSKLRKIFNNNRNYENWCKYKPQCNLCFNLLRKTKKSFYINLYVKQVSDNRVFWKNKKSFLRTRVQIVQKITLVEKTHS